MNISKYKFVLSALLVFIFTIPSFHAHADGVKIVIGGFDDHRHHHFSRHDNSRIYNRFYYENRAGIRDRYGNKFKNRYYGNESYGYGDNSGYSNRYSYRNRRSYCPY